MERLGDVTLGERSASTINLKPEQTSLFAKVGGVLGGGLTPPASGAYYPQLVHRKVPKMVASSRFRHEPDPYNDPIGELVPLNFQRLEALLLEFCTDHMRNPRAKELEDLIEACREEE